MSLSSSEPTQLPSHAARKRMYKTRVQAAALLLGLSFIPDAALAHSKKETTVPRDGAVLQASPDTIRMTFKMPMRITLFELRDHAGGKYDLTRSDHMRPVTRFEAVPATLPTGRYTIKWRGLSSDSHPMRGKFSFEIKD